MVTALRKLWSSLKQWVDARLSTPAGRLGAVTCAIGGITWYTDAHGDPPVYLTGLLALSGGAFLAALGADKQQQARDTADTAKRAESKADDAQQTADTADSKANALGLVASEHHPEATENITPPLTPPTGGAA